MGRICEDDLLTNVSVSRILDHQLSKNYQSHLHNVQNICVETSWFELHSEMVRKLLYHHISSREDNANFDAQDN